MGLAVVMVGGRVRWGAAREEFAGVGSGKVCEEVTKPSKLAQDQREMVVFSKRPLENWKAVMSDERDRIQMAPRIHNAQPQLTANMNVDARAY
jgi:hypothetical protein